MATISFTTEQNEIQPTGAVYLRAPTAYEGQPGFDFLQVVPTWWDETKVITGQVGELLVTARRKGKTWYVGGLSAKQRRELALPLSMLGRGRYAARIWKDAADAEVTDEGVR